MKSIARSYVSLACVSLLAFAVPAAHAEFKCDQLRPTRVDAVACAKAAENIDSLRQYVWRTRNIYGLQMIDYVRPQVVELRAERKSISQNQPNDAMPRGLAPPAR